MQKRNSDGFFFRILLGCAFAATGLAVLCSAVADGVELNADCEAGVYSTYTYRHSGNDTSYAVEITCSNSATKDQRVSVDIEQDVDSCPVGYTGHCNGVIYVPGGDMVIEGLHDTEHQQHHEQLRGVNEFFKAKP